MLGVSFLMLLNLEEKILKSFKDLIRDDAGGLNFDAIETSMKQ